ncbi:hypothetical protein QBC43DRAFT_88740 [Cladorrhinum sp. PSN259]|nr:hypothetical protein QBC43DRAFT_88740 [Cladorrhinum sp. PSN259]
MQGMVLFRLFLLNSMFFSFLFFVLVLLPATEGQTCRMGYQAEAKKVEMSSSGKGNEKFILSQDQNLSSFFFFSSFPSYPPIHHVCFPQPVDLFLFLQYPLEFFCNAVATIPLYNLSFLFTLACPLSLMRMDGGERNR